MPNEFSKSIFKSQGFTLIEILIVVAILAILTIIGIVVFTGQEQKARLTKVQKDFEVVSKQIQISRQIQNKTMCEMTQRGGCFSDQDCRTTYSGYPASAKVMDRPSCLSTQQLGWSRVTGKPYLELQLPIDPWGNIYTFDENEMEPSYAFAGVPTKCRWDMLNSAGRDGISWTADDYYYFVPPLQCSKFEFPEAANIPGIRIY